MADLQTYVNVSAVLSVFLAAGFLIIPDANYKCDSKQQVAYCFNLSSTGVTCYTMPSRTGGKTCTEGWKGILSEKRNEGVYKEVCNPCNEKDRGKCPPCIKVN